MTPRAALALLAFAFFPALVTGCGAGGDARSTSAHIREPPRIASVRLPAAGDASAAGRAIDGMRCERDPGKRFGAHLEIFVNRRDIVIPAGIGVAPPRVREGAYVKAGRCSYPVRTREPTGVIEVSEAFPHPTLGRFFRVWGQPLHRTRIARLDAARGGAVTAFVNGERRPGDPRTIPLSRHVAIVLEIGGYFSPTRRYAFPPGL